MPTGYLLGGTGDEFYISGNFLNNSTNSLWNTQDADLLFTGAGPHMFHLSNLVIANTWDELSLLNGAILHLGSDAASTLFLTILNGDISNIINTGLYPLTINYNGTELVLPPGGQPVPVPCTLLLLGSGLIGLAGLTRREFKG
jgi:hypothetical protein